MREILGVVRPCVKEILGVVRPGVTDAGCPAGRDVTGPTAEVVVGGAGEA
ncbi:hypothetical protein [Streptomyces sp. LMG1-1-1.1]